MPSYDYLTDLTVSVESTGSQLKWVFDWRFDIQPYELSFQQLASKPQTATSPAIVFDTSAFALNKVIFSGHFSILSWQLGLTIIEAVRYLL